MTFNERLQGFLDFCTRTIFFVAYAAFLYASLHHIAYFFAAFEPAGTSPLGPYLLAIAFDATALILSIRISVGKKNLENKAFWFICLFILGITAVSWLINYEYALQFQGNSLPHTGWFRDINPWIASSFAALNIAYSIVARFFSGQKIDIKARKEQLAQKKELIQVEHDHRKEIETITGQAPESFATVAGKAGEAVGSFMGKIVEKVHPTQALPQPPMVSQPESTLTSLGFLEQSMYNKMREHADVEELWVQSQTMSLQDFTSMLQERFSDYARHITEERVATILAYHRSQQREPVTDPEIKTQPKLHIVKTLNLRDDVHIVNERKCHTVKKASQLWGVTERQVQAFMSLYPQHVEVHQHGGNTIRLIDTSVAPILREAIRVGEIKSKRTTGVPEQVG